MNEVLNFQDDPRAALRDQRRIAGELDGIAEPLVVPGQPLQDEPDIIGDLGMIGRELKRLLAIGQRLLETLQAQLAYAPEVERAGLLRLDFQRTVETQNRFVIPTRVEMQQRADRKSTRLNSS